MKSILIVGAVQQPCSSDRQTNLDFSIAKIHKASAANVNLAVLPELHLGPPFCQDEDYNHFNVAQDIPGLNINACPLRSVRVALMIKF